MDPRNIGRKPSPFVCQNCKEGKCIECVDILRILYTSDMICKCKRRGHSGEPSDEQILDPTTGDVYAKALVIKRNGRVQRPE